VRRFVIFILALLMVTVVSACYSSDFKHADPGKTRAVTTIYPLHNMINELGGELISADYLLPPGASPHTFEPTAEQARLISGAELFVYIGAELDQWAVKMADGSDPGQKVLDLSLEVPLITRETKENDQDSCEEHGHDHGPADPHYWLDPVLVRDYLAPAITDALVSLSPADEQYFLEQLERYREELNKLDREIKAELAAYSVKKFITFHSAWHYFALRYNLEEVAVIANFPGQEPSAGWMAELVKLVDEKKIKVIFAEPQFSSALAEQIAAESGIEVLLLDPIGGEGLGGRETYLDLMRYNLELFKKGFSEE